MFKKYTFELVFVVFFVLFLPAFLLAQGAVVGYAYGNDYIGNSEFPEYAQGFPSNQQLDRLTHVIASDIGCKDDGRLYIGKLPDMWQGTPPSDNIWNGSKNEWLESLVNRAHAKGVKVSICVGGDATYFPQATYSANLTTFVSNIVDFVDVHDFDGVDIDWERPGVDTIGDLLPIQQQILEWNQCIALLQALRAALPSKRITIALPGGTWFYPDTINNSEQKSILDAVHAIHLMTYDESEWPNHSSTAHSINAMNDWISWQTPTCAQKKKLFLGSAFYGWHPYVGGSGQRITYRDFILNNDTTWNSNPGDLPPDARSKAIYTRDNGFGGVFVWELGYDVPADDSQSLLKAIDDVMPSFAGPTIVCNSATRFQYNNRPAGVTVSWNFSQNLVSAPGWAKCVYSSPCIYLRAANVSNGGPGWVQATISGGPCGDVVLPKHDVWVGTPLKPTFMSGFLNDGKYFAFASPYEFSSNSPAHQEVNYYDWQVYNGITLPGNFA